MSAILASENPKGPWWQLKELSTCSMRILLVGWPDHPRSVDSGIPLPVATILAGAMTSLSALTFPVSDPDAAREVAAGLTAEIQRSDSPGLMHRAKTLLGGRPPTLTSLSTDDPALAEGLFHDPAFPWHMQGQAALLSELGLKAPRLDHSLWLSILEGDWECYVPQLRSQGVIAIVRPGVDGDVGAVFSLKPDLHQQLITAVEREARTAGLDWSLLPENEFRDRLAS